MTILVTGGAGFIGANFILDWFAASDETIVNLDKLTYAGRLQNLARLDGDARYVFQKGDIGDPGLVAHLLETHRPRAVVNFAAESHVDRSIDDPTPFITTNVVGTFALLEAARRYMGNCDAATQAAFRFIQVSTDEVFGSLGSEDAPFTEASPYRPNSPYSASKASADHLVRAHYRTYGLPTIISNCSNNFGPMQYPEKLIPVVIGSALSDKPIPIYGDGQNVRDWLYVGDHCRALRNLLEQGRPGETYNIGGDSEFSNQDLVRRICAILDSLRPLPGSRSYTELMTSVPDRPGHDFRYAINSTKIQNEVGWRASDNFNDALRWTVEWYLAERAE